MADRRTVVRNLKDELKTGTLHAMLKQLGLTTADHLLSKMETFSYAVQLTADPDGGFVVTSRDLPEVVTQGDTWAQAIAEAEGALEAAIEMRMRDGLPLPPASAQDPGEALVAVPIATAMKAALYLAMREQGLGRTDLARCLGVDDDEAQRILSAIDQGQIPALETALHCLGKRPELHVA